MNEMSDLFPWIERAEEDYLLSVSALKRKRPLIYGATFHAQQCAEKYLKAILTFQQAPFPRTHDLAALGVLCQQNGIILPISDDDLERLSAYAVEIRYRGMQPTAEEAQDALQIARNLRKFAFIWTI